MLATTLPDDVYCPLVVLLDNDVEDTHIVPDAPLPPTRLESVVAWLARTLPTSVTLDAPVSAKFVCSAVLTLGVLSNDSNGETVVNRGDPGVATVTKTDNPS